MSKETVIPIPLQTCVGGGSYDAGPRNDKKVSDVKKEFSDMRRI